MARFNEINAQYFDDSGDPLSNGKIYFYETGTTTLKDTFSDINQTIPNTNPVILTASGRQPNIFFSGTAKSILVDKNNVQILVRDPVGQTASVFGDGWVATKIYSADAVVLGSDGQYYRSLASGNQNNNPTSTSGYWTLLYSVEWNSGITYQEGAVVTYNGEQYQSLQNTNLNNNPSSATAYWVLLSFAWLSTRTYAINENVVGTDGILYTSLQASNINHVPASSAAWWVGTSAAAAASASAAAVSATASASSASSSQTSATASETAKDASVVAKDASVVAKDASVVAKNQAETAKTGAETAQTAAETAKTAAETAETNAETAETNSANSATASSNSAAAALVSQNAAAVSATASSNSAASSSTDASTATTKAGEASVSAAAALVSQNAAAASATTSTTQAGISTAQAVISTTKSGESASSATAAAGSATAAAASFDQFNDIYLGAKSSAPTVDNDGNALAAGALYFNTVSNTMFVYSGSSWAAAGSAVNGTAERQEYVATSGQTTFNATYDVGFVDVYLNGSKLIPTTDFTATNGATVVLGTGAVTGDNVSIIAYGAFNVADVYTQAQSNARYTQIANNLSDLASASTARTNLGLVIGTDVQAYDANTTTSTNTQTLTNKTLAATTLSGQLTGADQTISAINLKDYGEITNAIGNATGAKTIDLTLGNSVTATTTGATTWTFSNPTASDELCSFSFKLVNGGSAAQTWPASVDWPSATAPTLTASGTDVLVFITCDGGTTWYGFVAGLALA